MTEAMFIYKAVRNMEKKFIRHKLKRNTEKQRFAPLLLLYINHTEIRVTLQKKNNYLSKGKCFFAGHLGGSYFVSGSSYLHITRSMLPKSLGLDIISNSALLHT